MDWERLRSFYETPLGKVTRRALRGAIRSLWPHTLRERVLGVGYAAPVIKPYAEGALALHLVAPKRFGATPWPTEGPNRVALVDMHDFPFPDSAYDKILILHGLEFGESLDRLLTECWRVLAPGGRILVCVPNRTGLWSHMDRTPFGCGLPFTAGQLEDMLRACHFTPTQTRYSLLMPPVNSRALLSLLPRTEAFSNGPLRKLAGVILMEAKKQVYQPIGRKPTLQTTSMTLKPA
jgi:SAM-dependent methyltransferase